MPDQRSGRRDGIGTTGPDRHDAVIRLDEIARARQQERGRLVRHDQQGLQPAQRPVRPPVFGQLDGRPLEVAAILIQLRFEARKQGEGIRGRAGESRQDGVVVQPPDLPGAVLDHYRAKRYLPVPGQHRTPLMAHGKNRRSVKHLWSIDAACPLRWARVAV